MAVIFRVQILRLSSCFTLFSRLIVAGLPALASLNAGVFAAEPAKQVEITYDLSVAGLNVGTGSMSIGFNGQTYSSKVRAEVTGIASLFFQTKVLAEGDGVLRGRRVLPSRYHLDIKDNRAYQLVDIDMAEGNVEALILDPPLAPRADRIPVLNDHRRSIVDPVGGVIVPRRTSQPFDPSNCNQTLKIFDGAGRFDLILQPGRAGKVTVDGYSGQVLVCPIRYKPVSGHRRKGDSEKSQENEGRIEVKLAPIEGRPFYIPLEISVPIGPGMFKLSARTATGLSTDVENAPDVPEDP